MYDLILEIEIVFTHLAKLKYVVLNACFKLEEI